MRIRNPLIIRILIGIFIAAILFVLIIITINTMKNYTYLTYDIGEKDGFYTDQIITNFDEYKKLIAKYGIEEELNESSFATKSYIASFQEYDSCAETEYKTMEKVDINDKKIVIIYKYHNKCGWCKKHMVLYLIQIGKVKDTDYTIEYDYDLGNHVNCGTI